MWFSMSEGTKTQTNKLDSHFINRQTHIFTARLPIFLHILLSQYSPRLAFSFQVFPIVPHISVVQNSDSMSISETLSHFLEKQDKTYAYRAGWNG